jgi:hypothetical protein
VTAVDEALEADLDALFQQLPAAHVAARDALAARLRKAGDREGAERIKKLKRPSPTAWALNQLHYHQPALLEAARSAAAELKTLHARDGIGSSELSAAVNTQRRAVQTAVDAAMRDSAKAGIPLGASEERKLITTLQAWLTGSGTEAPGRMTHELEASGFEAVGLVGLTNPRPEPLQPSAATERGASTARSDQAHAEAPNARAGAPTARGASTAQNDQGHAEVAPSAGAGAPTARGAGSARNERAPSQQSLPLSAAMPRATGPTLVRERTEGDHGEASSRTTHDNAHGERPDGTRVRAPGRTREPKSESARAPVQPNEDPELLRARTRVQKLEREAAAARERSDRLQTEREALEREATAARERTEHQRGELAAVQEELERLRQKVREVERALVALQTAQRQGDAALHQSRNATATAESSRLAADESLVAARAELARLEARSG